MGLLTTAMEAIKIVSQATRSVSTNVYTKTVEDIINTLGRIEIYILSMRFIPFISSLSLSLRLRFLGFIFFRITKLTRRAVFCRLSMSGKQT